jgi:molecular chaperone DnaK
MAHKVYVGIDLGTTNTTCSVAETTGQGRLGEVECLPIRQLTNFPNQADAFSSSKMLPSVVCLTDDGHAYVGEFCKFLGTELPNAVIVRSVKLQMGNPAWSVQAGGRNYHPRDVAALILRTVRKSLEKRYPDADVAQVTITIPASFSSQMRQETLRAAKLAGFAPRRLQLIDEPVAALFSQWDSEKDAFPGVPKRANVLVFDMGGGTLDVSILNVNEREVNVVATSRYNEVAGNDFDLEIAALILKTVRDHSSYSGYLEFDPSDPAQYNRRQGICLSLLELAEQAKFSLKDLLEKDLGTLDYYFERFGDKPETISVDLRAEFGADVVPRSVSLSVFDMVECLEPFLRRPKGKKTDELPVQNIFVPVNQALERAQVRRQDIRTVYLTGGSSFFPLVRSALRGDFGSDPSLIDPFFAVSTGAVIWGFLRTRDQWKIAETIHDGLFLKRKGRSFLPLMSPPIAVPSAVQKRKLDEDQSPYLGGGGRMVRLEFFQGLGPDDPFMTVAHVEHLHLPIA